MERIALCLADALRATAVHNRGLSKLASVAIQGRPSGYGLEMAGLFVASESVAIAFSKPGLKTFGERAGWPNAIIRAGDDKNLAACGTHIDLSSPDGRFGLAVQGALECRGESIADASIR